MTSREAILALDLGTSSVKSLLVSRDGTWLGNGGTAYPTIHPETEFDEQRVEDWLGTIATAVAEVDLGQHRIAGIALTGQMHGTVCLDDAGAPIGNAIIWSDRRAACLLDGVTSALPRELPLRIGGPLATGYQALTLAWLRTMRPDIFARTRRVLLPVDFLAFALTGTAVTDPSNAVSTGLLDARAGTWDRDVCDALGVPGAWLPQVVPTGTRIVGLTEAAARRLGLPSGTPVFLGGGDAPASAVGTGVRAVGTTMITLSSGAQIAEPSASYEPDPLGRWHTWPAALAPDMPGDRWLRIGALLNAGNAIRWAQAACGPNLRPRLPQDVAAEDVGDAPSDGAGEGDRQRSIAVGSVGPQPGENDPIFLPYLAGERSPFNEPNAAGALVGLTRSHTARQLHRAVREGVALAIADTYEVVFGGRSIPGRMVLGGGGAADVELRQLLADVLGRELDVVGVQNASARGAAIIAATRLGWIDGDNSNAWAPEPVATVAPDFERYHQARKRLDLFREARSALLPIMHRMAAS